MSNGSPSKPKWTGRLNSAMRKSSTILSFGRPSTPSRASSINDRASIHERDSSDSASITKQKVDTSPALLSAPTSQQLIPSPINESPVREAAATESSPPGPSPLNQEVRSASPDPIETSSPVGYIPPPVVDFSIGNPGAFTDQMDEELPQPVVVSDPFMPPRAESNRGPPSTRVPSVRDDLVPAPIAQPEIEDASMQAPVYQAPPLVDDIPARLPTPSFDQPPAAGASASYFDPTSSGPVQPVDRPTSEFTRAVEDEEDVAHDDQVHEQRELPMPEPSSQRPSSEANGTVFNTMPMYDLNSETEIWGGAPHPYDQPANNGGAIHHTPSIKDDPISSDPFSNPVAPRITISRSDAPTFPNPHVSEARPAPPAESDIEGHAIVMPFPPLHEVIPAMSPQRETSTASLAQHNDEIDETRPLLPTAGTSKGPSYLQPNTGHNTHVAVSPIAHSTAAWNPQSMAVPPRLHEFGWIEYHLPDGTFYYVHPTRRVTTDVNLRTEKTLHSVTTYLDGIKESAPPGCELWLRDAGTPRKGFIPSRSWVNHQVRSVIVETFHEGGKQKKKKAPEDDQLDMEYRYWSFMESHPAHTTLPLNSKTEAFEALSWAWADRLLPSSRVVPAPFTQEECQELNSLLRSFTADQPDTIQTRLVARILVRVAIWRQAFFRPHKPLPQDVAPGASTTFNKRRSVVKTFIDILISIICLGIPYIFFERHHQHRLDEESGLRNTGPMFIIGACTCLVAAIVLSASVTFLSLPGLDGTARIPGLVATLFASFSMASTLVAIFKYKADIVRSMQPIGEGLTWVSKRSLIFSLPLVFLAYSIIGFITGIVLYSFRGANPVGTTAVQNNSGSHTRWTTWGAVGALAGILTMSLLLGRR